MFNSINVKLISKALGLLLLIESGFMGIAVLVALYYGEDVKTAFLPSLLITFGSAVLLLIYSRQSGNSMGKRDGYLIVSLAWALFSFFGAIPFFISGYLPSFVDAYFETVFYLNILEQLEKMGDYLINISQSINIKKTNKAFFENNLSKYPIR